MTDLEKKLTAALWAAWRELNTIRARDGVPYTHAGRKVDVDEGHFSRVVDDCDAAITDATGRPPAPWPPNLPEQPHSPKAECLTGLRDEEIADLRRNISGQVREMDRIVGRNHDLHRLCLVAWEFLTMPALASTRIGDERISREELIERLAELRPLA